MKIVSNEEFLSWASYRGVHLDARYQPPQTLVYPNGAMTVICAELPKTVVEWTRIVSAVFNLLPRKALWLYRRGGTWDFLSFSSGDDTEFTSLRQGYNAVLKQIGVPIGECALQFSDDEHALVLGIMALQLLSCCAMRDDIFIVPEAAEFCIWVDHHDQLILVCRNSDVEERLRSRAQTWGVTLSP
jgi:hypothetical protein